MAEDVASGSVIGRADELAALQRFLVGARQGLRGLVIEGAAGIGKTTILEAGTRLASTHDWRILQARPAESERDLTLGGLTDLFATFADATLAVLPLPQRRALEVALLRAEESEAPIDQRTLSVAATGLLREVSTQEAPILIAIDDAQWLDPSSASVAAYALRRLSERPVGVLLSVRTDGRGQGSADDLIAALPADRTDRLVIGPIPLAALHRLFEDRFGRSFPRVTLVRIAEASGGNPFYALEIARALHELDRSLAPGEPLPIPPSLGELVRGRIYALAPPTQRALLLVAASSEPTVATLRRADTAAIEALEPALAEGIISIDEGIVRFAHPLLAQAVISSADPDRLRAADATLAAAVSSTDARARHAGRAATGPSEKVARELELAGAAARSRGATLDAATLYEQSSLLTPLDRDQEALRRARLAAECLFVDISEAVQADAMLERALSVAPPGPARAEALSLRAILWYYHGRVPDAVALCERALAEGGAGPIDRSRILVRLAFLRAQLDVARGQETVEEAVRLLEGCDAQAVDPDLLANALLLRASTRLGLIQPVSSHDVARGRRLITANGRSWERENAEGLAFGLARHTDDLDRAIAMTEELIRSKSGVGGDDPFNLVQLSGLLCLRGNLAEARRVAEAAMDGYAREGSGFNSAWSLRGVALVAAYDGRADEAVALARRGLELALRDGNLVMATFHHHILGFVALSLGQYEVAHLELTEAAKLAERTGNRHPARFKLEADRMEAALALGRRAEAGEIVRVLEHAIDITPTPWVVAAGARCRGMLEAADGDLDRAVASLERAVAAHGALPMPFELGRTQLVKGQVHRRRKEKRLATGALEGALAAFEQVGVPLWAQRARTELSRVGLRPRAPDTLTATERRVAELAATGLRTRRIAEIVFLSPKTVGNVLGRVYPKLGIHSRAELGALMAREERILTDEALPTDDQLKGRARSIRGHRSG